MTSDFSNSETAQWSSAAEQEIDPVMRKAIEWFTLFSDGQAGDEFTEAHQRWLAAAPEHRQAYSKVQRLWSGATQIHALNKRRINRRRFGKLVLLVVAGAGSYGVVKASAPEFTTENGESRLISLADGSQIRMSGGTALSITMSTTQRDVILHHGEAYFTVARGNVPFSVYAASGRITALGTQFNIALLGDLAEVLVTEHAVKVEYTTHAVTLHEGQKLTYAQSEISAPQVADRQVDLSWLEGRLVFIDRPLGDVVQVLNRWSATRLRIMDSQLARRPVTLIINIQDIDKVLQQLARSLPVKTRSIPLWGTLIYRA